MGRHTTRALASVEAITIVLTSLSAAQAPADQPVPRTDDIKLMRAIDATNRKLLTELLGPPAVDDHAPPPTGDASR